MTNFRFYLFQFLLSMCLIPVVSFRFAEIQDVVDTVLYLLSDKASMITGTCLPVDGGFLAA